MTDYPDNSLRRGDKIKLVRRGCFQSLRGWSNADTGKTFTFDRYQGFGCLRVLEKPNAHVLLQGSFERA